MLSHFIPQTKHYLSLRAKKPMAHTLSSSLGSAFQSTMIRSLYLYNPERNMSTMEALSRPAGQYALATTYTDTTVWVARFSMCRSHSSLSCIEKAVMLSCPPRWTSTNGAHKDMSSCPGSLARTARWPRTKTATESADKYASHRRVLRNHDELRCRQPAKRKRNTCKKRLTRISPWISHDFHSSWTAGTKLIEGVHATGTQSHTRVLGAYINKLHKQ